MIVTIIEALDRYFPGQKYPDFYLSCSGFPNNCAKKIVQLVPFWNLLTSETRALSHCGQVYEAFAARLGKL